MQEVVMNNIILQPAVHMTNDPPLYLYHEQGFYQFFCPRGGGGGGNMRLYGLLGGMQLCIRVQSMWQKLGGSGGMLLPENFDFGRHNLVESGTTFTQT